MSLFNHSNHTSPGLHQIDHAVPVNRDVLLRDHLDHLLRDEPAEEGGGVGQVGGRGAGTAA
jgi:hypothetical protein